MSIRGKTILVKGEVWAEADVTIEGRVEGLVMGEGHAVTIEPAGHVKGDVRARDITVFGRTDGELIAAEVVDLRAEAVVTGRVITRSLIINDGALFNGRVEPQHLEAALRVADFNRQKRRKPG